MKPKSIPPKTLAVFLSLIISLPNPAWALRQSGLEENKAKDSFLKGIGYSSPAAGAEEGEKRVSTRTAALDAEQFLKSGGTVRLALQAVRELTQESPDLAKLGEYVRQISGISHIPNTVVTEKDGGVMTISPYIGAGAEERVESSEITLPQLVGTHPFPVRVFTGPDKEEVYVRGSSGKMRYPLMTLLGETVKREMGNDYAAHLSTELIDHLTTATPKEIRDRLNEQIAKGSPDLKRKTARDGETILRLKALVDRAGVLGSDMAVEAAVNHLVGPTSPGQGPSYARLIGYVNRALRGEGNPRPRLVLSGSISSPQEIKELDLWMVKQGDITHVFQAEVRLRNNAKVRFVVNVAKDLELASVALTQAYQALSVNYAWDPRFVMEPYGIGVGQATFWNGKKEIPVFVGEWFDGFDELHLYSVNQGRFSVWQEHQTGIQKTLSRQESDRIWAAIVGIQALYSREKADGIVVSQVSVNGGDFVARQATDGSWQVLMVWDRSPGVQSMSETDPASVLLGPLLPIALGDGRQLSPLILWGRPDWAIRAAYHAWLDHARFRSQPENNARRRFLAMARRAEQITLPALLLHPESLPLWSGLSPADRARLSSEVTAAQQALIRFLFQETASAGAEEKEGGKKKKAGKVQAVDLADFLEPIKKTKEKGGDVVRFFDGREGPFARVPPEGVKFSWLDMIGDRSVGGLRLFTGGKDGGDWFLRVASQAVGELDRVYIRLHRKENPDTWKPVGTVAAEGAPGPVEYGGIVLQLIPGGREVLIRPAGDEPVFLTDNLLLKKVIPPTAAGTEERQAVFAATQELVDGFDSLSPPESRAVVVIGSDVVQHFPGLQVFAGMEQRVVIDRGGDLPDTLARVVQWGDVAYYYGDPERGRQLEDLARRAGMEELSFVLRDPQAYTDDRLALLQILRDLQVPAEVVSAGFNALASGLEQLGEAA